MLSPVSSAQPRGERSAALAWRLEHSPNFEAARGTNGQMSEQTLAESDGRGRESAAGGQWPKRKVRGRAGAKRIAKYPRGKRARSQTTAWKKSCTSRVRASMNMPSRNKQLPTWGAQVSPRISSRDRVYRPPCLREVRGQAGRDAMRERAEREDGENAKITTRGRRATPSSL